MAKSPDTLNFALLTRQVHDNTMKDAGKIRLSIWYPTHNEASLETSTVVLYSCW